MEELGNLTIEQKFGTLNEARGSFGAFKRKVTGKRW
jgi:hypothetical protein